MLPIPAKATVTAKRIPHDEMELDRIFRKTCFATREQTLAAGFALYGQAFLIQENGGRPVLRNEALGELEDVTVMCSRTAILAVEHEEIPVEKQWEFTLEPHEFFLAKRLVALGAAPNVAALIRWVLVYFDRVVNRYFEGTGWKYGVLVGETFLPLLVPGDPAQQ